MVAFLPKRLRYCMQCACCCHHDFVPFSLGFSLHVADELRIREGVANQLGIAVPPSTEIAESIGFEGVLFRSIGID